MYICCKIYSVGICQSFLLKTTTKKNIKNLNQIKLRLFRSLAIKVLRLFREQALPIDNPLSSQKPHLLLTFRFVRLFLFFFVVKKVCECEKTTINLSECNISFVQIECSMLASSGWHFLRFRKPFKSWIGSLVNHQWWLIQSNHECYVWNSHCESSKKSRYCCGVDVRIVKEEAKIEIEFSYLLKLNYILIVTNASNSHPTIHSQFLICKGKNRNNYTH